MTIKHLYPTQRPALDLNFAQQKRLDRRVTFTRSTTGTYVDSNGVIKTAAANEARFDHDSDGNSLGLLIEESRTNLITASADLPAIFVGTEVIASPNAGTAPDGTLTATKVAATTASALHFYQATVSSLALRTLSLYAKADGENIVNLGIYPYTAQNIEVDLSTGTIVTGTGTVTPAGNGWYRISYTVDYPGRYTFVIMPGGRNSNPGDGASGVLVWGAQLEEGDFPTSYIPTLPTFTSRSSTATYYDANGVIQTAAIDVARDDAYLPDENGVLRPVGLLLEESRTNSLTYSAEFDNAAWTKTTATVSPNATTSPDNTISSEKLIPDSGFTGRVSQSKSFTSGVTYSQSVFAKEGEFSTLKMASNAGIFPVEVTFDLSTGTISSLVRGSATITPVGNGWYRCTATATAVLTSSTEVRYFCGDVGDGTSGIYIWGAQLEQGSFPTSYIPTTGATATRAADISSSATVTRAADIASMTGTNFSSWYNQSEGTVFIDLPTNLSSVGNNDAMFSFHNGSTNRVSPQWVTYSWFWLAAGTQVAIDPYVSSTSTAGKYAFSFDSSNIAATYNGQTTNTVTSSSLVQDVTGLRFFTEWNGGRQVYGHISRFAYYPVRLTDEQLQTLTL